MKTKNKFIKYFIVMLMFFNLLVILNISSALIQSAFYSTLNVISGYASHVDGCRHGNVNYMSMDVLDGKNNRKTFYIKCSSYVMGIKGNEKLDLTYFKEFSIFLPKKVSDIIELKVNDKIYLSLDVGTSTHQKKMIWKILELMVFILFGVLLFRNIRMTKMHPLVTA